MEGKVPPPKPSFSQAIIQSERTITEIDNSPWSNKLVLARRGPVEEVIHMFHSKFVIIIFQKEC